MRGRDETLAEIVRAAVREELKKGSVPIRGITGAGGNTTVTSDGDIFLTTKGTHKAYYNGTELATGGTGDLSDYMRKDSAGGNQSMYNDIHFENLKGCVFYNTASGPNVAGAIRAFSGVNYYDFVIDAPNGYLYLDAGQGIRFAASAATALNMGDNVINSLGAPVLVGDAARYKDGVIVCTSGTRPASPTEGMHIYETDTDKDYKCTVGGGTPTWTEVGGGGISGTQNKLAKFATATTLGDSLFGDDGTTITAYGTIIPTTTDTYDLGSTASTKWWKNIYAQAIYLDDANTYISNSAGSLQLHVAAGETIDIVVG